MFMHTEFIYNDLNERRNLDGFLFKYFHKLILSKSIINLVFEWYDQSI